MSVTQDNNKRIAKNTLFLYARMLIVMVVSLFTVRVTLSALGAEDYGINNVVGGVVTMFAFLTSTMISASQRFFAYELGKNNYKRLSQYFTMSFWCYVGVAVIVIILAETIGLWFVCNKLTIPANRMEAALWVYQFSIVSFAISILSIPFNSIIIARERMNIYALFGLLEAFMKLAIAYILMISPFDKLIVYSGLMCLMMSSVNAFYIVYSISHFEECRIRKYWQTSIFKEVMNYSGWSLFGAISGVLRSQGINILLNIFFNPIVNAARAIAYQVNNAINQFVMNFFKAVQPQITKYYASGEQSNFIILIYRSSRFCYFLILFLALPILIETPYILKLWLKEVPDMTILFTRLVILTAMVDSTSYSLQTSISATGKIKWFQIVTGGLLILTLPVDYIFLRLGFAPEVTMYVAIVISCIAQVTRILFAHHYNKMSISDYAKSVLSPIILVTSISIIFPYVTSLCIEEGFIRLFAVSVVSIISTVFLIYTLGITSSERKALSSLLLNKLRWNKQ